MRRQRKPIAIDLFCGVGGMSLGFEQAGFDVVAGFDSDRRSVTAYKQNFGDESAFVVDLSAGSSNKLLECAGITRDEVELVFGGPPCQGFSNGGTRSTRDPRNEMLGHFARLVHGIRPNYFVMENVDGLLHNHAKRTLNKFLDRVDRSGYDVVHPVTSLDAADFGVPQRRRRAFILGYRRGLPPLEYPTPRDPVDHRGKTYSPTVHDAIGDLPEVSDYPFLVDEDSLPKSTLGRPSHYARLMRGELVDPDDRSGYRRRKGRRLTGCLATIHSREVVRRFQKTKPGFREPVSRYFRLDLDSYSPTLRAGTDIDHGKHTAPRPIHPLIPRCITTREAARLHSFPDWFSFNSTRWHAFRQIGNSVPPRLARAVAEVAIAVLAM